MQAYKEIQKGMVTGLPSRHKKKTAYSKLNTYLKWFIAVENNIVKSTTNVYL